MERFKFESIKKYHRALKEVEILVQVAQENEQVNEKYLTYLKVALLLLLTKFETFAEDTAQEYVDSINYMKLPSDYIPISVKVSHTTHTIKTKLKIIENITRSDDISDIFMELAQLWIQRNDDVVFNNVSFDLKFNYGKHGENDLRNLFKKIGHKDIFTEIKVFKRGEGMIEGPNELDFKGMFNSNVRIRNNIIHEDATPNLTYLTIKEYTDYYRQFSEGLVTLLEEDLEHLENLTSQRPQTTLQEQRQS